LCNLLAQSPSDAEVDFKKEVEKELSGRETEPWEIIYFKLYARQIPCHRESDRNGDTHARKRPISRLLP
jgi:hypothetical protein